MKFVKYYNVPVGAYADFFIKEESYPEVLHDNDEWVIFSSRMPQYHILTVPTWQYQFDTMSQLNSFLMDKLQREGYYIIAARQSDVDECYVSPDKSVMCYFYCFGIAYFPDSFLIESKFFDNEASSPPQWLQNIDGIQLDENN